VEVAYSKNGVPIRLSSERWLHIVENHDDLAGYQERILETVSDPDAIARGKSGELLALKKMGDRTLVVVYKELARDDGFVVTAFFTSQPERIQRRGVVWRKS